MTAAQHTPGPLRITADAGDWSASHEGLGTSSFCGIRDGAGTVVALAVAHAPNYGDPDCRGAAERVVQCVNVHDKLEKALLLGLRVMPVASGLLVHRPATGESPEVHCWAECTPEDRPSHLDALLDAGIAKAGGQP